MGEPPTISAAKVVLELVLEEPRPSDLELLRALDRLAAAYHEIREEECRCLTDADPPDQNYNALRKEIGKRFSDFGYYKAAGFTEQLNEEPLIGDAVDDLVDLVQDLRSALWYFENSGAEDAYWFLRLQYFHWARHLRELALYLHTREFG